MSLVLLLIGIGVARAQPNTPEIIEERIKERIVEYMPGELIALRDPGKIPIVDDSAAHRSVAKPSAVAEKTHSTKVTEKKKAELIGKPNKTEVVDSKEEADENKSKRWGPYNNETPKTPPTVKTPSGEGARPGRDLPTIPDPPGDPFAGPNGFSDMIKDDDPWAINLLNALSKGNPPSFGGVGTPGVFRFRISICPNGTIEAVQPKSSTGDKGYDMAIRNEIIRVKIPKPPANVAKQLKGKCKRIPYIFSYGSNRRVR